MIDEQVVNIDIYYTIERREKGMDSQKDDYLLKYIYCL